MKKMEEQEERIRKKNEQEAEEKKEQEATAETLSTPLRARVCARVRVRWHQRLGGGGRKSRNTRPKHDETKVFSRKTLSPRFGAACIHGSHNEEFLNSFSRNTQKARIYMYLPRFRPLGRPPQASIMSISEALMSISEAPEPGPEGPGEMKRS